MSCMVIVSCDYFTWQVQVLFFFSTLGFQKEADSLLSVTKLSTISDSKNTRGAREILLKLAEETTIFPTSWELSERYLFVVVSGCIFFTCPDFALNFCFSVILYTHHSNTASSTTMGGGRWYWHFRRWVSVASSIRISWRALKFRFLDCTQTYWGLGCGSRICIVQPVLLLEPFVGQRCDKYCLYNLGWKRIWGDSF